MDAGNPLRSSGQHLPQAANNLDSQPAKKNLDSAPPAQWNSRDVNKDQNGGNVPNIVGQQFPASQPVDRSQFKASFIAGDSRSSKIVRFFVALFNPGFVEKKILEASTRHNEHVKYHVGHLEDKLPSLKLSMGTEQYGNGNLPDAEVYRAQMTNAKGMDKVVTSKANVGVEAYKDIPQITSGDGTVWHAVGIRQDENGNISVQRNSVIPTSERHLGISKDLNNIYIGISSTGTITIASGIIDSETRAHEFMHAVAEAIKIRNESGPFEDKVKIRVSSHSLNALSNPGETKMIKQQNAMASLIDRELGNFLIEQGVNKDDIPKGPVMSHVNRTLNGFTKLPGEESKNHKLNQVGMAVQMNWLGEDLQDLVKDSNDPVKDSEEWRNFTDAHRDVYDSVIAVQDFKKSIAELKPSVWLQEKQTKLTASRNDLERLRNEGRQQEATALGLEIKDLEKDIKKTIKRDQDGIKLATKYLEKEQRAFNKNLKTLAREMNNLRPLVANSDPKIRARLEIGGHVLAMQTGLRKELKYPKLSPAQELQTMMLLDQLNGAVTGINCKSGLDRTSIPRSLGIAMNSVIDSASTKAEGIQKAYDFAITYDENVNKMDKVWRKFKKDHPAANKQVWLNGQRDEWQNIGNFQNKMFAEWMGVSRPITAFSTGTDGGMKWHHSKAGVNPFEKNLHPLPFIPTEVTSKGETIILVKLDRKGNRTFTPDGLAIFEGQSQKRGG